MSDRQTATRLLTHYLRLSAQRAGVQWDSDNDAEVAAIVDALITASVRQAQYEALQVLRRELSEDGIALVHAMAQDKEAVGAAVAHAVELQAEEDSACHDPMDVHESPSTTPYYHERED